MNTKLLLVASAIVMGILGLGLIFLPDELIHYLNLNPETFLSIILQITGALYFGFASLNWMGRGTIIGGIYGRPLAVGNSAHFLVGAMVLIKETFANPVFIWIWVLSVIYFAFAVLFGLLLFGNPAISKSEK